MDTPANTFSTFPTRQFTFILDPVLLFSHQESTYRKVLDLIIDLKTATEPIDIYLLTPIYFTNSEEKISPEIIRPPIFPILKPPKDVQAFNLDSEIPQDHRLNLLKNDGEAKRCISLLTIAEHFQADGLITTASPLLEARYSLHQRHRIRIIPLDEIADVIEVCAHGHSIFWSASNSNRNLIVDSFYQLTHWKNSRLFNWFNKKQSEIKDENLRDNLHASLLIRYPFIVYSRDMVRFYELQRDHCYRRGLFNRFFLPLGYHMNNFYFHLWGMLEQLTLISKYVRNLEISERDCGIKSKTFWKEFSQKEQGLAKLIGSNPFDEWISTMADMRHLAAHKAIQAPAELVMSTEESKKSDEDILKIVRKENADLFKRFPKELVKILESQMVYHWRMKKMKRVADNMVLIKGKTGEYFRNPVVSIDYDLTRLNAVVDAFLIKLFSK